MQVERDAGCEVEWDVGWDVGLDAGWVGMRCGVSLNPYNLQELLKGKTIPDVADGFLEVSFERTLKLKLWGYPEKYF